MFQLSLSRIVWFKERGVPGEFHEGRPPNVNSEYPGGNVTEVVSPLLSFE